MAVVFVSAAAAPAQAAPLARFGYTPASPVTGQPVNFDATASTCPAGSCRYAWVDDGPDGPGGLRWRLGRGRNMTFTFRHAGTKYVRLRVTDRSGARGSTLRAIEVKPPAPPPAPPVADFSYSPGSPVAGGAVSFDAAASTCPDAPCSYSWVDDGPDGPGGSQWPLGSGRELSFTFRNAGNKHVRLLLTDRSGDATSAVTTVAVSQSPPPPPPADAEPPETSIEAGPSGAVTSRSASFSFASSEAGSSFECGLDDGGWTPCSSPQAYAGLADGAHTFRVRATDASGNTDASPASQTWTVEDPTGTSTGCDREATPETFASEVAAAEAGQTICLASGSYGTWSGTGKQITIRASDGAAAQMRFSFGTGDAGFTLDGLGGMGGSIGSGARDITIRNSTFTSHLQMNGLVGSNILLEGNTHNDIDASGQYASPARIHLSYPASQHSGVTIRDSKFIGGSADGIQTGPAVNIIDNEFAHIREGSCSSCHTDAIQLFSGSGGAGVGSTVRGNYIRDSSTGIVAFDGTNDLTIEDNVVWGGMHGHAIVLGGDRGSQVVHNTAAGLGLDLTSRAGTSSRGTVVRDNILARLSLRNGVGGDATPAVNTHNMLASGASGTNLNGRPSFVEGESPSRYLGFRLAPDSQGRLAASDGTDVGIR